ncbi:secretin receptor isoform X2 [Anoplolepis gracilipes]|uniref:secretin receptor isoform X2 n=1 Tax=Anoplolepis gracilipes TaxID=354296 RepID=UPI003B9F183B
MATHSNGEIERIQSLMIKILQSESERCNHGNILGAGWCPEIWDEILCWNSTAPGQLATQHCPSYIMGFEPRASASKQCMPNGQWYMNADTRTWSNYSQCYQDRLFTVLVNISDVQANNVTLIKLQKFFPIVKTISKLGYTISLFTLIIAFCILAAIKKLRCSRNILHMHLFVSFVMRAFMALLKDLLFVSGIGLSDAVIKDDEGYWLINEKDSNWHCKMFTSLWQYFILANYSWILMEGVYLHNLIFLALFTDANSSVAGYVAFGWGLPAVFILPWVVTRIIYEDTYCWTTNDKPLLFLFIRVPTMLSILINFVLFINIVRVLLVKLKSTMSEETQRYKRWARSTLVLVPLFGVHYAFFIGMSYSIGVNETVEIVWLFCDQLFASFQGFFVAVLYCFLNGEVRAEVSRTLRNIKWMRLRGIRWGPRPSTHSVSTCSCNNVSKSGGRHSRKSKWWKSRWKANPCLFEDRVRQSTHSMASTQDARTRGCSLASSKDYVEIAGNGQILQPTTQDQHVHHTSPMCSKYTDQSLLSFCSNMSDASGLNIDKIRNQYRWSDSECCHLSYELQKLQQHHEHQ